MAKKANYYTRYTSVEWIKIKNFLLHIVIQCMNIRGKPKSILKILSFMLCNTSVELNSVTQEKKRKYIGFMK